MKKIITLIVILAASVLIAFFYFSNTYNPQSASVKYPALDTGSIFISARLAPPRAIPEPNKVKAIHLSYGMYNSARFPDILEAIKNSQVNAIIFEVKNELGRVALNDAFHVEVLKKLLPELNRQGIYTVARIVLFQDPFLVGEYPDLGIQNSATKNPWADNKGLLWSDPTQYAVWEYNINVAKKALDVGFNEINFDYVRFPTDGPVGEARYKNFEKFETKENTIVEFLRFTNQELGKAATLSVDVFGISFVGDQKEIGQSISKMALYVDIIAPMSYPSHYPEGFIGLDNPAENPYEIVVYTLREGIKKLKEQNVIIRPWIQDFSLGAIYGDFEIKEQIRALGEFDIDTWMLWNASNNYTYSAISE